MRDAARSQTVGVRQGAALPASRLSAGPRSQGAPASSPPNRRFAFASGSVRCHGERPLADGTRSHSVTALSIARIAALSGVGSIGHTRTTESRSRSAPRFRFERHRDAASRCSTAGESAEGRGGGVVTPCPSTLAAVEQSFPNLTRPATGRATPPCRPRGPPQVERSFSASTLATSFGQFGSHVAPFGQPDRASIWVAEGRR